MEDYQDRERRPNPYLRLIHCPPGKSQVSSIFKDRLQMAWPKEILWSPQVRIANPPPALLTGYTEKEKRFFSGYAEFVLRTVEHQEVRDRLRQVLNTERICIEKPVDIRIMVFPARPLRGRTNRTLHGSYSHSASQISLYPLKFPREWIRFNGPAFFETPYQSLSEKNRELMYEISETAIATLLHELLHVKLENRGYGAYGEEAIVRKLERQYMEGWHDTILTVVEDLRAESR